MWELDYKDECRRIDAFELWCWRRLFRVPWTARRSNQSILKEISPEYSLEGLLLSWNSNPLATWCEELTPLKRLWCWERLKAGGEGDGRGWDCWMASLTRWTWVWVNSGSWWWPGRPGVPQSMGSQRVRHVSDWTELQTLTFMLLWLFKTFWSSQISNTSPAFYAQRMVTSSFMRRWRWFFVCFWPHYGIFVPRPGMEAAPSASLHWKCRVLMTDPPRKSLKILIDLISRKGILLTFSVCFFIPLLFLYSCILSVHDRLFVNVNLPYVFLILSMLTLVFFLLVLQHWLFSKPHVSSSLCIYPLVPLLGFKKGVDLFLSCFPVSQDAGPRALCFSVFFLNAVIYSFSSNCHRDDLRI